MGFKITQKRGLGKFLTPTKQHSSRIKEQTSSPHSNKRKKFLTPPYVDASVNVIMNSYSDETTAASKKVFRILKHDDSIIIVQFDFLEIYAL